MSTTQTPSCPIGSIGERFNPLGGEQLADPYPFYAEARGSEPVFFSPALQMWVVTTYRHTRAVLADPGLFSSWDSLNSIVELCPEASAVLTTGLAVEHWATNTDEPAHGRWRRTFNPVFQSANQRLGQQIREITRKRLDALAPLGRADVLSDLGYPIPLQVIARLCDVGDEHLPDLARWGRNWLTLFSSAADPATQVEAARVYIEYQQFLRAHLDRKRAEPGGDFVSAMITGGGDEPFSESEIVTAFVNVFVAGHDTTAHLIGNAVYQLLVEPSRWRKVVADPSLIPAAVEEVLRIDPPVPTFIRTATANTTLAGHDIAKGDTVLVVYASANRDAEQFDDPTSFDLDRKNGSQHLSFGHGIHYCVAASLARLEARVVLEALAERMPDLRLVPDQEFRHLPTLIIRGFERIEVEWDVPATRAT